MRIVQAANFVTPTSGGLRTTLRALADGYARAGHEVIQVVPGEQDAVSHTPRARVITVRAPKVPLAGGYRVMLRRLRLRGLLDALRPDRLEVSDRLTLRCVGLWARDHGVPAVVISHERLDAVMRMHLPGPLPARAAADYWNRRIASAFDTVVCTTNWARQEFDRVGATNVAEVPLGVDLTAFCPARHSLSLRRAFASDAQPLLVMASRLSPEKRPDLAIGSVAALRRRGVDAHLVIAGDGPARAKYEQQAQDLPVTFLGFVSDRGAIAQLLATADVALAPGPVETFGLSALEALACGTPVVGARTGALPELLRDGVGVTAYGHPNSIAVGVQAVLSWEARRRRAAARQQAERFPWAATVDRMLALHRAA